jgi:hypothetical protein
MQKESDHAPCPRNIMEFHIISTRSCFIDVPIRAIHSEFFHGKASRGGSFPTSKDYRLQHEVDLPLRLHKNAHNIAEVFCPDYELVVSERIAGALHGSLRVDLFPVEFATLYSHPYKVGDLDCGFLDFDAQMRFIDKQKDSKHLHDKVGRYFHVRPPSIHEVHAAFPEAARVNVQSGVDGEIESIPNSPKLFETIPIFDIGAGYVMGSPFYDILASGIDWTYFTHVSHAIS